MMEKMGVQLLYLRQDTHKSLYNRLSQLKVLSWLKPSGTWLLMCAFIFQFCSLNLSFPPFPPKQCTCQLYLWCIYNQNYNRCLLLLLLPFLPLFTLRPALSQSSSASSSYSSSPPIIRPDFPPLLGGGRFLLMFAVQVEKSMVSSLKAFLNS